MLSRLGLMAVLASVVLLVDAAPSTDAQTDQPPAPKCSANAYYDVGAESCIEIPDPTKGVQSTEDALAQDLTLIAEATGWTMDQAEANHNAAEAVGDIAIQIAAAKPDVFVGSVLSQDPYEAPAVYIKGPADDFVRALVANSETEVRIIDGQPYSFEELEERKVSVHRALEERGFDQVSAGFDITAGGRIEATVTRQAGLPDKAADILPALPASLRGSVDLDVIDSPVLDEFSAFGGMWVRDNGIDWCTSGWSVWNASGTTGVTTAGHCGNGVDQINDPAAGLTGLAYQGGHQGQWGDVEWLTSGQLEPAQFYATNLDIRFVNEVEPIAGITQGEYICMYGRASNSRNCSRYVDIVSKSCGGLDRLVQMNGSAGTNGDSGGGWSNTNKAYGSVVGLCGTKAVFSVADYYDEALGGVSVRVAQTLPANGILWPTATSDERLTSPDGRFVAAMQTDGNFVIYRTQPWTALWSTSLCGQTNFASIHAVMQSDGNFVLYPSSGSPARWATSWAQTQPGCISNQQTVFGSGVYMTLQNDGNLVMYKPGYGAVWASNTCCY